MSEDPVRYGAGPICPDCSSTDIVPIAYGFPTPETQKALQRGEVALGGCCISDDDPTWICRACGRRWGRREVV